MLSSRVPGSGSRGGAEDAENPLIKAVRLSASVSPLREQAYGWKFFVSCLPQRVGIWIRQAISFPIS